MTESIQHWQLQFGFGKKGTDVVSAYKRDVHFKIAKSSDGTPTGIYTDSSIFMNDVSNAAKTDEIRATLKNKKKQLESELPAQLDVGNPRFKYKLVLDDVRLSSLRLRAFVSYSRMTFRLRTSSPSKPKLKKTMINWTSSS